MIWVLVIQLCSTSTHTCFDTGVNLNWSTHFPAFCQNVAAMANEGLQPVYAVRCEKKEFKYRA
jgi:hypothetical protein